MSLNAHVKEDLRTSGSEKAPNPGFRASPRMMSKEMRDIVGLPTSDSDRFVGKPGISRGIIVKLRMIRLIL